MYNSIYFQLYRSIGKQHNILVYILVNSRWYVLVITLAVCLITYHSQMKRVSSKEINLYNIIQ